MAPGLPACCCWCRSPGTARAGARRGGWRPAYWRCCRLGAGALAWPIADGARPDPWRRPAGLAPACWPGAGLLAWCRPAGVLACWRAGVLACWRAAAGAGAPAWPMANGARRDRWRPAYWRCCRLGAGAPAWPMAPGLLAWCWCCCWPRLVLVLVLVLVPQHGPWPMAPGVTDGARPAGLAPQHGPWRPACWRGAGAAAGLGCCWCWCPSMAHGQWRPA